MMPVYFNVESHLWIAYLFFVNGLLLSGYLRSVSHKFHDLTKPFEAFLLGAFFISLSFNGLALLVLDVTNQSFERMAIILPILSLGLIVLQLIRIGLSRSVNGYKTELGLFRLVLYVLVFILLFYNGGLIEQSTDAWWHMSLANKIGIESTFALDYGHLNGVSSRYYPPLWHGNLALAKTLSDISLPVLWNSFTAWGAVLKVMGFYLLSFSLSRNKSISILSALLFVLLPGMGDAYLRVSAWPSHIAYVALFGAFYTAFYYIDGYHRRATSLIRSLLKYLASNAAVLIALVTLMLVLTFTHQLEIVWFYAGLLMYCLVAIVADIYFGAKAKVQDLRNDLFILITGLALLTALLCGAYLLYKQWADVISQPDISVSYLLPMVFFIAMVLALMASKGSIPVRFVFGVKSFLAAVLVLLVLSIDVRQLLSLVNSELAYPGRRYHELPLLVEGFFGGKLTVPGWHLQLRSALLYSGLISIPLSVLLAIIKPSRLTLFTASNAVLVFLICVSPYLYEWLSNVMYYHSSWRIAILIFHPIIIATALHYAWLNITQGSRK